MIISKVNAIHSLLPDAKFSTYGDQLTWDSPDITQPTQAEIDAEIVRLEAEYDAQEYARNRKLEYPSIDELVVALYDEDDKAAIEAKRAEIKAKYPKP